MNSPGNIRYPGVPARLLLVGLAVVFYAGCSGKNDQAQAGAMMAGPVPVTAADVIQKTVPVEIHAIGNGEAFSTVTIKSQVDGIINQVNFTEGQFVKKGDVLFRIDPRPFEAALAHAEANLAKDTAQAHNAQAQMERNAKLYQAGIVSQDQYDQFRTNADAMDAAVRADQAAVETEKINLGYCTLRSPIDGRTGSLLVHPGNLVKNNDTSLVVINQISPLYVDFSVPEQFLPQVKERMANGRVRVEALIPHEEQDPVQGVLSFVDNKVDAATGTVLLKGTFENSGRRLWPGQFANIDLILASQPNATAVSSTAIQTGQNGLYVYVIKPDMTVEVRPVVVGTAYQGFTVIEKGLRPGEKVVTDGQLRLYPGAKVSLTAGPAPAQDSKS